MLFSLVVCLKSWLQGRRHILKLLSVSFVILFFLFLNGFVRSESSWVVVDSLKCETLTYSRLNRALSSAPSAVLTDSRKYEVRCHVEMRCGAFPSCERTSDRAFCCLGMLLIIRSPSVVGHSIRN